MRSNAMNGAGQPHFCSRHRLPSLNIHPSDPFPGPYPHKHPPMPALPQTSAAAFRSRCPDAPHYPRDLPYVPSPGPLEHTSRLHAQLRERLLALSYRAFLQTVLHLLSAWGYDRAVPAGRSVFKGRNTAGGWDLEASGSAEGGEAMRAIAQVKQFATLPVQQRMVDELRGCLLRAGAQEAWLITLSTFSGPARMAALSGGGANPVRLLDGEGLVGQMVQHEIGICRSGREWAVNDRYFRLLEERFAKGMAEGRARREPSCKRPAAKTGSAQGMPPSHAKAGSMPNGGGGPVAVVRVTVVCGRFPQHYVPRD